MTHIEIGLNASRGGIMPIVTAVLPAVTALLGVWLTLWNTNRRSGREDRRNRGVASLAMAEHLEDFVIHCSDVTASVQNVVWTTPYTPADFSDSPVFLKELPDWPPEVDWRVIGFDLAVEASNFRRKVRFAVERVRQESEHLDYEDTHVASGDEAIVLAPLAWSLAVRVRQTGHLKPFEWPNEWSAIESVKAWAVRRAEMKRRRAAAEAAADGDDDSKPSHEAV